MSIQMTLDGLSFSVYDPVRNSVVALGSTLFNTPDEQFAHHEEYLLKTDIFKDKFKKTIISIESRSFSILPKAVFDPEKAANVLSFIGCNIDKNDKRLFDKIEMANAVNVFAIPSFLYYFLQTQFNDFIMMHYTTPVVRTALMKRDTDNANAIAHVIYTGDGVTMVVVEQNTLKLCNKFKYNEINDLVYIIMFTLDQLGLNNDSTKIVISGDVDREDARAELIRRFAHNVSFAKLPDYLGYELKVPEPEHQFVNLFNMSICV
ncbi:MAG: DUF3822 family protein [Bacteroidales bacterium]|nr:DUF3822 family protein [Bacteroidales bacterium]